MKRSRSMVIGFILFFVGLGAAVSENEMPLDKAEIEFINNSNVRLPQEGMIRNAATAIAVAEVLFVAVYGETIKSKEPFVAQLIDEDFWFVRGTLRKGSAGGVPYIVLKKSTGEVVKILHTR